MMVSMEVKAMEIHEVDMSSSFFRSKLSLLSAVQDGLSGYDTLNPFCLKVLRRHHNSLLVVAVMLVQSVLMYPNS